MTTAQDIGVFAAQFETLATQGPKVPDWIQGLRRPALDHFLRLGFPTRRDEEWKYTNVRSIQDHGFELSALDPVAETAVDPALLARFVGEDEAKLVFVDGVLSTAYSNISALPTGVEVMPLMQAFATKREALNPILSRPEVMAAHNPFSALNQAFLLHGAYVEVKPGVESCPVIHIVYVTTKTAKPRASHLRNVIVVGERAEASVVETYVGAGENEYFVNTATDVQVKQGGRLKHCKIQAESIAAYHLASLRMHVERDAKLETFCFSLGSRIARSDLDIVLGAEGAEAVLDGLYLARGKQHVDHHTSVDHKHPHGMSSQLYKGILDETARGVFNGKIYVRKDAQQTNAFQLNKNLLLSSEAEIDTKPQLEIDADDVKCSHGAAIGQLSKDEIFYLQSRGIDKDRAIRMLSQAFADEVLFKLGIASVRDRLRRLTEGYYAK